MIHLIRVYHNDQIQPIHVETFGRDEPLPSTKHRTDCRCMPTWSDYYEELAERYDLGRKTPGYYQRYEFGRIDMEWIYPTPKKRNT